MARIFSIWRNLLRRARVERELDDEVRATFDLLVDEKMRAGMTADDARRAARLELGTADSLKEQVRAARAGASLDTFLQDVRYGGRLLCRNPIFAFTAVVSLAIGLGATTTIFTVANGLLLRAAAGVPDPDRVVDLTPTEDGTLFTEPAVPLTYYQEVSRAVRTLEGVYAHQLDLTPMSLRTDGAVERVFANAVTTNYFTLLGISAAAGRVFAPAGAEETGAPVAVLSHRFWARRFNKDAAIVGRTVQLNAQPFTVIGVAPEGFHGTSVLAPDMWVPVTTAGSDRSIAGRLMMGGRLKRGVSFAQAAAEVATLGRTLSGSRRPAVVIGPDGSARRDGPAGGGAAGLRLDVSSPVPGNIRLLLAGFAALLMATVSLVLVIACANLAGALLARATSRRREISVRLALGAGRARLVRQLLTETILLFVLGGAAGLMLARAMTAALVSVLPAFPLPLDLSLPLDGRVIAFASGISFVAAVLCGLAPALAAARTDVVSAMKDGTQGPAESMRLRNTFVVAQVAFSVLLVAAAGLLVQALDRSTRVDRGFDSAGVEITELDLAMAGHTAATGPAFVRDLADRLRRLPGVEAATIADRASISVVRLNGTLTVPGAADPAAPPLMASWNIVEAGYFSTLRSPLQEGRDFGADDSNGAQLVTIVDEATARRLWPGESPIGKVVQSSGIGGLRAVGAPTPAPGTLLVVGVARNVTYDIAAGLGRPFVLYVPMQQHYRPHVTILTRASGEWSVADDVRALISSMDPNLPILSARTLDDELTGPELIQLRLAAAVSGSVGLVGLLLASIGVYGVTAYVVARRTREIGIRLALGAQRADVIGMVLWQGMSLVAIGAAIGLALAVAAGRVLAGTLTGISPFDAAVFLGTAALLAAIGLAACYGPVARASRVNAMDALRYE